MRGGNAYRGLRRAALAVAAAGAVALGAAGQAQAHPPAPFGPKGRALGAPVHKWLHQAKAPLVRGRVRILIGRCPGAPDFVGCIFTRRPRVIYLSREARQPRAVLYHELGHTFDLTVLRPRHRRAFKRLMGIRTRGWFTSRPPAAEYFADAYALCADRRRLRTARAATPYGYRATPGRHRAACALIRDAPPKPKPDKPSKPPPPRPPSDAPPVAEPTQPPPSGPPPEDESPSGPYQPPGTNPSPPDPPFPGCGPIEQILTGCDPG
jgi:hypothetical protein